MQKHLVGVRKVLFVAVVGLVLVGFGGCETFSGIWESDDPEQMEEEEQEVADSREEPTEEEQAEEQDEQEAQEEDREEQVKESPELGEEPYFEERLREMEAELDDPESLQNVQAQATHARAVRLAEQGNLEKAYEEASRALELDPGLNDAAELRNELAAILGYREEDTGRLDDVERRMQAILEQERTYIESGLKDARQLLEEDKPRKAKEILDSLEMRLRGATWIEEPEFERMRREVEQLRSRARTLAEKREREIQKRLQNETEEQALKEERKRMLDHLRTVDRLMERGVIYLEQKEYEQAARMGELVLDKFPNYEPARKLRKDANRLQHEQWKEDHMRERVEEWKNFQHRMQEARIPQTEKMEYPDQEHWDRVNQRVEELGPITPEDEDQAIDLLAIERQLETEDVNMEFVDAELETMLSFIQEQTGIPTVLDRSNDTVQKALKKESSVIASDITLKNALGLVTNEFGLDYNLKHGAIQVSEPENAYSEPELHTYNVQEVVNRMEDFGTTKLGLDGGEDSEQSDQQGTASANLGLDTYREETSDTRHTGMSKDHLVRMIRENIAPDTWKKTDFAISATDHGQLFVRHTPEVQARIERTLNDLRTHAGSMVSIEVRFLSMREEQMEDFGVEIQGLGVPTADNLDSGIFHAEEESHDFRFHSSFEGLDPFDALRLGQEVGSLPDDPGTPPLGGLGLTVEMLDEIDFNVVLRALAQSRDVTVLDSTHLTVYNTQRAHVAVSNQQAYIEDFDVEISRNARAYNPIIGTVESGLILDVRPIISYDRRFVTLELQPGIADLLEIVEEDVVDLTPFQSVVLQLPRVDIRRAGTTVRIPDKGAALIGGIKQTEDTKVETRVPVLGQIPIFGALFKRTLDVQAARELMILVNVEIIDTAEREREAHGGYDPLN